MEAARRLLFGERLLRLIGVGLRPTELRARLAQFGARDYCMLVLPSCLAIIAASLIETGVKLPAYPRVIVSHAESLTPVDAALIEQAFRAPIVNHYSAYELLHLAQTCPDNPELLHVNSERIIVRVVRDDGSAAEPGEEGRLILTDLWNEVMPFINYDIGDRAALGGPCPCGRGFATLTRLEGRASELIRTPDGRVISPVTLGRALLYGGEALPFLWEYQAIQTAPEAVTLRLVPTPRFDTAISRKLQQVLEELLGPDMVVRIEPVAAIPKEPSGKRLLIKSALPPR
jgi:phenylacetate-CoA ligase